MRVHAAGRARPAWECAEDGRDEREQQPWAAVGDVLRQDVDGGDANLLGSVDDVGRALDRVLQEAKVAEAHEREVVEVRRRRDCEDTKRGVISTSGVVGMMICGVPRCLECVSVWHCKQDSQRKRTLVQDDREGDRVDEIIFEIGNAGVWRDKLLGGVGLDEACDVMVDPPKQNLHARSGWDPRWVKPTVRTKQLSTTLAQKV